MVVEWDNEVSIWIQTTGRKELEPYNENWKKSREEKRLTHTTAGGTEKLAGGKPK